MKVLQINSVCGIGSTGRIATDIHDILIEQGHESYIAYGRDLPKNCENAIRIGTKIDNYTHVAKTRLLDKHGFGSIKATKEFINKVIDINPDIIHLHNIHGYYINIEILFDYLKEANKPVVWTFHDCWSFTGHCAYFDYVGCNKWKTGCYSCPEKKAYPSSLIFDNSKNNYINKKEIFTVVKNLTIVTPSQWLANLVQESFLNEYPVKVINNGILR
jgi:putative colanic acid biosynthesis glycosyltransferase